MFINIHYFYPGSRSVSTTLCIYECCGCCCCWITLRLCSLIFVVRYFEKKKKKSLLYELYLERVRWNAYTFCFMWCQRYLHAILVKLLKKNHTHTDCILTLYIHQKYILTLNVYMRAIAAFCIYFMNMWMWNKSYMR